MRRHHEGIVGLGFHGQQGGPGRMLACTACARREITGLPSMNLELPAFDAGYLASIGAPGFSSADPD
jgi:hypothetical protein